jgi:triosephosphate isomerase
MGSVAQAIDGTEVSLGAQDLHWETQGAYTGEVSAAMLLDLGCRFVIVGHSERRAFFGETDVSVNRKTGAAIAAGLCPIVCVGETLEQRERGETEQIVRAQVERGLEGLGHALREIVVAYEPVWAIGTGRTATAEQAQSAHGLIRETLAALGGAAAADTVRIQYGGSVKPGNAAELFSGPDVDGGLIGGASLDADSFAQIVRAAG